MAKGAVHEKRFAMSRFNLSELLSIWLLLILIRFLQNSHVARVVLRRDSTVLVDKF